MALASDTAGGASLSEALALFNDWDREFFGMICGVEEAPSDSSSSSSSSSLGPKPRQRRSKASPYQQRKAVRDQEAAQLRSEIEELQRVLESEKAKRMPEIVGAAQDEGLFDAEWEDIAQRQQEERIKAEVLNTNLHKLATSQTKAAKKLLSLTQRSVGMETVLGGVTMQTIEDYQGPAIDVKDQLRHIDMLSQDMETVFQSPEFVSRSSRDFREIFFRENPPEAETQLQIEFVMAWALPFTVEEVADALWHQTTRMTSKEKTLEMEDLHTVSAELVSRFVSVPKPHSTMKLVHGQIATRRLPKNPENDVIVLISSLDAVALEGKQSLGHMRGDAWLRVEPVQRKDAVMSRIQWCRRVSGRPPASHSPAERSKWLQHATSSKMKQQWERSIEWNIQAVENLLLTPRHSQRAIVSYYQFKDGEDEPSQA